MNISFHGIGQECATFLSATAQEGHVVKISGRGTVDACSAGEDFCGVALCRRDGACTVQIGGFVTVSYTGAAPTVGWTALAADGAGGVKAMETGGKVYLAADVDTTAKTVTIKL